MMRESTSFNEASGAARGRRGFAVLLRTVALAGLCFVASGGDELSAAPLYLIPQPPDITSAFITVNYDADTGMFSANGFPAGLDLPPGYEVTSGAFSLSMAVAQATGQLISGALTITGTVPDLPLLSSTLLTGEITSFGFLSDGGEIFEFLVDVTGGELAGVFGSQAGIILDAHDTGFGGSFQQSFESGPFQGLSDTFPVAAVPEPASVLVWLSVLIVGGCGLVRMRDKLLPAPDPAHLV